RRFSRNQRACDLSDRPTRSGRSLGAEEVLGDHAPLHLARPFPDLADLRVPEVAFYVELPRVAVATVHLERAVARTARRLAREKLRHGCFLRVRLSAIGEPRGPVRQERG